MARTASKVAECQERLERGTAIASRHLSARARHLTVKLRARPEAPEWGGGCTLLFGTGGDTTDVHGPLQRLLGASPKPIASQLIKRSDCSVFINLRHVREDDNSWVYACAVLHEDDRFIQIREKHVAFLVLRPIDVLDLGKHKPLAL